MLNASITGANPSGACTPLTDFKIRTDVSPSTQWRCSVTGTWRQVIDSPAAGVLLSSATQSTPSAPASGNLTCWMDPTLGWACINPAGTVTSTLQGNNPIGAFFSNGGSAIAANDTAFLTMTRAGTLAAVYVAADASIAFQIDKSTTAGGSLPSFSTPWSGATAMSGTVAALGTGSFTSNTVAKGDIIAFKITTPGSATQASVTLEIR